MNDINLRSEHISRYEARLKHLDELLERAHQAKIEAAEHEPELKELKELAGKRKELASHVDEMSLKDLEHWQEEEIEKAGPMALWDAVAQQLEKLVERLEKK